jgi:hypothetical protein
MGLVIDAAQTYGMKWLDLGTLFVPLSLVDAKGDLIVGSAADTVGRLAVGATNDHVLTVDSALSLGVKWAAQASGAIAVTAALPGSPANGDKILFVDSTTAPTYAWLLQYISAKASNKWQFMGGSPASSEVATSESTTSATYAALTTAGPSFTLPVAGDYEVSIGAYFVPTAADDIDQTARMSYDIGGTGAVDADSIANIVNVPSTANADSSQSGGSYARSKQKAALTAVALTAKYKTSSGTCSFSNRWMTVTPIALGG